MSLVPLEVLSADVEVEPAPPGEVDPQDVAAETAVESDSVVTAEPTEASDAVSPEASPESPPEAVPETTADSAGSLQTLRQQTAERIATSAGIPRGMRQRLTDALRQAPLTSEAGELLAPVSLLLSVIEEWAPGAFRLDPGQLRPLDHPAGEGFFTGDPRDVSDEQAAAIARQQLERSGYLPRSSRR